jgi:hypothetical protein
MRIKREIRSISERSIAALATNITAYQRLEAIAQIIKISSEP